MNRWGLFPPVFCGIVLKKGGMGMNRSVLKIICIVSGILFALLSVLTVYSVIAGLNRINAAGGIIGGAGAHAVKFLLQDTPSFHAAIVAFLAFIGTGLGLIFGKKAK